MIAQQGQRVFFLRQASGSIGNCARESLHHVFVIEVAVWQKVLTHYILNSSSCGGCSSSIDVGVVEVARRERQLGRHLSSQRFIVAAVAKARGWRDVLRALLLQQEVLCGRCLLCQGCLVCCLQQEECCLHAT